MTGQSSPTVGQESIDLAGVEGALVDRALEGASGPGVLVQDEDEHVDHDQGGGDDGKAARGNVVLERQHSRAFSSG